MGTFRNKAISRDGRSWALIGWFWFVQLVCAMESVGVMRFSLKIRQCGLIFQIFSICTFRLLHNNFHRLQSLLGKFGGSEKNRLCCRVEPLGCQ